LTGERVLVRVDFGAMDLAVEAHGLSRRCGELKAADAIGLACIRGAAQGV
jgi:hypothetical protein